MSKTRYTDLFDFNYNALSGLTLASKALEVRDSANRIAKLANSKQIENGEYATLFASNIKEWMDELSEKAEAVLQLHLEQNADLRAR